ncbi:DeoR/GlpR family DNA-binding transcription regulator [Lachnospiraceae bacterium 54-53]
MMLKDRLDSLRSIMAAEKKVKIADLSLRLGVTEETVRKDLERLELEGLVTRTYGCAELKAEDMFDRLGYIYRSRNHVEEKKMIAEIAANIIPLYSTLAADASSTAMETLMLLKDREDLTVLTNSIPAISTLNQSKLNLMSTGGVNNRLSCSLQGIIARNTIMNYHVDFVLTSCKGLKRGEGIYDSREGETEIKQLMMSKGEKVILMADHHKFDRMSFVKYCGFEQVDILVTDRRPSDEWLEMFDEFRIQIFYPSLEVLKSITENS